MMHAGNRTPSGLLYKPDWPEAQRRWKAYWDRTNTDRPIIDVKVRRDPPPPDLPAPKNDADRYMDPDYFVCKCFHYLNSYHFLGEAVPTNFINMGGYAVGCGPAVRFDDSTVYHPRLMRSIHDPMAWKPDKSDIWTVKIREVLEAVCQVAPGKFIVAHFGANLPVNDLLPLIIDSSSFMMSLADELGACAALVRQAVPVALALRQRCRTVVDRLLPGQGYASSGYGGLWSPDNFLGTQSDMSCMISPAQFRDYVLTELDMMAPNYDYLFYHLDGQGAIRHLPAILSRPYIRAVNFVPEAGTERNGPAYMDLYRRIQAAGRCVDMTLPIENVEPVVRGLSPEGVLLHTEAGTVEQAEELLAHAVKWTGSDRNKTAGC